MLAMFVLATAIARGQEAAPADLGVTGYGLAELGAGYAGFGTRFGAGADAWRFGRRMGVGVGVEAALSRNTKSQYDSSLHMDYVQTGRDALIRLSVAQPSGSDDDLVLVSFGAGFEAFDTVGEGETCVTGPGGSWPFRNTDFTTCTPFSESFSGEGPLADLGVDWSVWNGPVASAGVHLRVHDDMKISLAVRGTFGLGWRPGRRDAPAESGEPS